MQTFGRIAPRHELSSWQLSVKTKRVEKYIQITSKRFSRRFSSKTWTYKLRHHWETGKGLCIRNWINGSQTSELHHMCPKKAAEEPSIEIRVGWALTDRELAESCALTRRDQWLLEIGSRRRMWHQNNSNNSWCISKHDSIAGFTSYAPIGVESMKILTCSARTKVCLDNEAREKSFE